MAGCTGGAVIDSGNGNAAVQNATVTWGTDNLLSGQVWVRQSDNGYVYYNPYGNLSSPDLIPSGRNVVKIQSGSRSYMFVINHQYSTTCHNPGGGTMSCSEDVFDIGNGSPPATTIDSTFAVTPTAVPVHKPDACMTMCVNAPANADPSALGACYGNCYVASTNQVPSLDTWLQSYPAVANRLTWRTPNTVSMGWANFTESMRASVRQSYANAWMWLQSGLEGDPFCLVDPPPNVLAPTLRSSSRPSTALGEVDAWNLWSTNIGLMMALQFGRGVPWDLGDLDSWSLAQLLDSRSMFNPEIVGGNEVYSVGDGITAQGVPVSPSTAYRFLVTNGLIGQSRRETIDRTLDWVRQNLKHFGGGQTVANMEAYWQYPGLPPMVQVLNGTYTSDPMLQFDPFGHWTLGCHGTTALLKSLLMAVQVPVANGNSTFVPGTSGTHAVPYFVSEQLFLDHGDDPYDHLATAEVRFPIDQLLLNANDPANQLIVVPSLEGLPVAVLQDYAVPYSTLGKQVRYLAIGWQPWLLAQEYCIDVANNATHAGGLVYNKWFAQNYDVSQLESLGLWGFLQQTVLSVGGCANVPNIPDTSANGSL
jgi:hypothetical protein